jgi:hypothetical protein
VSKRYHVDFSTKTIKEEGGVINYPLYVSNVYIDALMEEPVKHVESIKELIEESSKEFGKRRKRKHNVKKSKKSKSKKVKSKSKKVKSKSKKRSKSKKVKSKK